MDVNGIRVVANAILYEGYMLYPYRPSALKNRSQGWTFGTLLPHEYAGAHPGEPCAFRSQVLVVGRQARLSAEIRFLQLGDADARERSVELSDVAVQDLLAGARGLSFTMDEDCIPIEGKVRLAAARTDTDAYLFEVSLVNESQPAITWETRDAALRQALVSAHALLTVADGEFVSLMDPPDHLRAVAEQCKQSGVFPVLAGDTGQRSAMLISPIILYDYPRIAAGSHGDFYDSSEIDEMLTLRVLTLTDDEKREVLMAGERVRSILQRTESLSPEDILKLHGVVQGAARGGKE